MGTQSHVFKALVLPTFIYGTGIWEGDLKSAQWKVLKKGMKTRMMSLIKVRSPITYHILLAGFQELPWNHMPLSQLLGFENVVLGSLKSFFQLDQQVDISLYRTHPL